METIKSLNLKENDFKLIIDGLDALPERGAAGELMGDMLIGMFSKKEDDPAGYEKMKREVDANRRKREQEKQNQKEEIKILQGKLLMLKRYLIENNLIDQSYSIINHIK